MLHTLIDNQVAQMSGTNLEQIVDLTGAWIICSRAAPWR